MPTPFDERKKYLADHISFHGGKRAFAVAVGSITDAMVDRRVADAAAAIDLKVLSEFSGYEYINLGTKRGEHFTFDASTEDFDRFIDPKKLGTFRTRQEAGGAELVIFFNAHGAAGWSFGDVSDDIKGSADLWQDAEIKGAVKFADFVIRMQRFTGAEKISIVLNSCNSATEMLSPYDMGDGTTFLPSSARIVSKLLPGVDVVGFVGDCADSKINNVYYPVTGKRGTTFDKFNVKREIASVMFAGGAVVSDCAVETYVAHTYTQPFMMEAICSTFDDLERTMVYKATGHERAIRAVCQAQKGPSASTSHIHGVQMLAQARAVALITRCEALGFPSGVEALRVFALKGFDIDKTARHFKKRRAQEEEMDVIGEPITHAAHLAAVDGTPPSGAVIEEEVPSHGDTTSNRVHSPTSL